MPFLSKSLVAVLSILSQLIVQSSHAQVPRLYGPRASANLAWVTISVVPIDLETKDLESTNLKECKKHAYKTDMRGKVLSKLAIGVRKSDPCARPVAWVSELKLEREYQPEKAGLNFPPAEGETIILNEIVKKNPLGPGRAFDDGPYGLPAGYSDYGDDEDDYGDWGGYYGDYEEQRAWEKERAEKLKARQEAIKRAKEKEEAELAALPKNRLIITVKDGELHFEEKTREGEVNQFVAKKDHPKLRIQSVEVASLINVVKARASLGDSFEAECVLECLNAKADCNVIFDGKRMPAVGTAAIAKGISEKFEVDAPFIADIRIVKSPLTHFSSVAMPGGGFVDVFGAQEVR